MIVDDKTQDLKEVPDDQLDTQLTEISSKAEKSEDDVKQLETIKQEKQTRYQKRIDKMTWENKTTKEELAAERAEKQRISDELAAFKSKPSEPAIVSRETIEASGEKHYTDRALQSMISSGQITDNEAWQMQEARKEAVLLEKVEKRYSEKQQRLTKEQQLSKEIKEVYSKYPHFSNTDPKHNPNDPLFKEVNELYKDGMSPLKALKYAEKMHGVNNKRPDISDNLSLHSPTAPITGDKKAYTMTEDDIQSAWLTYRNEENPVTGRNYTKNESIAKYKRALEQRKVSR